MRTRKRLLLLEDEPLLEMLYDDILGPTEFDICACLISCKDALTWLIDSPPPDVAVLDYLVSDGYCGSLADELERLEVPFVIVSGHNQRNGIGSHVPMIEKPFNEDDLLHLLRLATLTR